MKTNPWIAAYQPGKLQSRYAELERRAVPVEIRGDSLGAQTEVLRSAMREIFLCGVQGSAVLDQLLSLGEGHAIATCSTPHQVMEGIYKKSPWGETGQPAVMLTGLAGTGKTQLILAMKRYLEMRAGTVDIPAHRNVTLRPGWFMTLKDGHSLNALLSPYLDPELHSSQTLNEGGRKALSQNRLLELARRVSRRDGACLLFLDEFQFITRSEQANTLAMSLLLQFLSIGPRVVYVANFSLARRLLGRRQEDRHRVLVNHLELLPEAAESLDFQDYVNELVKVAPADWSSEVNNSTELLHRYTFGIKRAVVELLVNAWMYCKMQRGPKAEVNTGDLRSAFASAGYTPFRMDIEALWRHSIGQRDINPDLLNPLRTEVPAANVVVAQAAINSFNQRVNERHLEDMLTPDERAAYARLASKPGQDKAVGKIRRLPNKLGSKVDLLNAFNRMGNPSDL